MELLLEYWGVRVESRSGLTRIHVPPPRSVAALSRSYWWTILPLLGALVFSISSFSHWWRGDLIGARGQLPGIVQCDLIVLIAIAGAVYQLRRYVVLEVTDDEFLALRVRHGRGIKIFSCPRDQIDDIHINRSNSNLVIRSHKSLPVEVSLTTSMPMNEWIARQIQDVLASRAPSPKTESNELAYASGFDLKAEKPPNAARQRAILLSVAAVLFLLGVASLYLEVPGLSCVLPLLACVPIGIAYGTQEREYYI